MTAPDALVVLDVAGTLSFDTVGFARPDRLTAALRASGLAALGVETPEVFWSQVVEPTWQRGSTTDIGYATVVADAVADLRRDGGHAVDDAAIRAVADAFAARYLANSTIAEPWWPWLRTLVARSDTTVVIATDHYAEMTSRLVMALKAAGIAGTPLPSAERGLAAGQVAVANSADVGCHKTDVAFWDRVHRALPAAPSTVLVVDDFGANESPDSAYGDRAAVRRRRVGIISALTDVFELTPQAYFFEADPEHDNRTAIDEAGRWLETVLATEA